MRLGVEGEKKKAYPPNCKKKEGYANEKDSEETGNCKGERTG
jgi:hypothetical protein